MAMQHRLVCLALAAQLILPAAALAQSPSPPVLTGAAAYDDWRRDAPGVRRHLKASELPAPFATPSSGNHPRIVPRAGAALPKVPAGFTIATFASGLSLPRLIRAAPNGDIFVAEMGAGRIRILRPNAANDRATTNDVFASGLRQPFGIAFYPNGENPEWVYIANTDSVVRFPYRNGDTKPRGPAETIVAPIPTGGHITRDVVFSPDGATMYVSVGSLSYVAENLEKLGSAALQKWIAEKPLGTIWGYENERATVLAFDPQGKNRRIFATGLRNCVGMALNPANGELWCSTNERDLTGDDLVPDYMTRVRSGGFYGWPWYYIGANEDPRHKNERPDLKDKVTVPDILIQSHSAPLQMMFYTGTQFPDEYRGSPFVALHGSWNRAKRTGYKIIRGIMKDGVPTGEYEDFVTGFVMSDSAVSGRPVGVTQMKDGSLLFSEDGNSTIWRVSYGSPRSTAR